MRTRSSILSVGLILVVSGCSNTRFLADDQLLYTGREKIEIIDTQQDSKSGSVNRYVKSVTSHKVNNGLFGRRILPPIGLWVHNYRKVDEQKKFGSWLYNSLSSDPVLITDVNPELRTKKIESDLFDQGYFQTRAWSVVDTSARNPKKAGVSYFVEVGSPSHYDQIRFKLQNSFNIDLRVISHTRDIQCLFGVIAVINRADDPPAGACGKQIFT